MTGEEQLKTMTEEELNALIGSIKIELSKRAETRLEAKKRSLRKGTKVLITTGEFGGRIGKIYRKSRGKELTYQVELPRHKHVYEYNIFNLELEWDQELIEKGKRNADISNILFSKLFE